MDDRRRTTDDGQQTTEDGRQTTHGTRDEITPLALPLVERSVAHIARRLRSASHTEWTPFLCGTLAVDCATLLDRSDRAAEPGGLSRDELLGLAARALSTGNKAALHAFDMHDGTTRPNGYAVGYPALAALMLGDALPPEVVRETNRRLLEAADWYLGWRPFSGIYYDTKAEETAWEVIIPVLAQAVAPDHPHRRPWYEKAREMVLNAYSRECDAHDRVTRFDGIPLADLIHTANVLPDFTVQNHEGFNPCYQMCNNQYAAPWYAARRFLGGVPDWFTWNWAGLHEVSKRLLLRDGRTLWPSANDYWPQTHVGFANYHALMADALGCGVSLWALRKCLRLALDEQTRNGDGALYSRRCPNLPLGWHAQFTSFACIALWFAPYARAPRLTDEEALAQTQGALISNDSDFIVQNRGPLASSFSWTPVYGRGQAFGMVQPADDSAWTEAWTSIPNLVGSVRLTPEARREIKPCSPDGYISHHRVRTCDPLELVGRRKDHQQGTAGDAVWSLGRLLDDEGDVLHVVGLIASPAGALHVERFVRYGQKNRVAGAETLNYHLVNEPVDREGFVVEWTGGREIVRTGDWSLSDPGDTLVLDEKLALVRLAGNTVLRAAQARPERERNGIGPKRPWRLRVWGERCGPALAPGYAVLAEQVTLFLPARSVAQARDLARAVRAEISPLGEVRLRLDLPEWRAEYRLECGSRMSFASV